MTMMLRCLLLLACLLSGGTVGAAAAPPPPLTADDTRTFLNSLVPSLLARGAVAGAAIVVVKDEQVLFAGGFGHDDLAAGTRVDPDRTLFQVASISKLFTTLAVLRLVDAGRLDLDADIRTYVPDLPLAPLHGTVTLRHLLTHSAGFEEVDKFSFLPVPADVPELEDFVRNNLPRPLYPPGSVTAYSNYGAALSGLIVQRVSGQAFSTFMRDQVLRPLGMTSSGFDQPAAISGDLRVSKAYVAAPGPEAGSAFVGMVPAGGLSATPADMGRFMRGLLAIRQGATGGLLRPETLARAWSRVHSADPGMAGMGIGFIERSRRGLRIFGHDGSTPFIHSSVNFLIDEGVAIFITTNSLGRNGGGPWVRRAVFEAFIDRYFAAPVTAAPTIAPSPPPRWVKAAEGAYRDSRWAASTFLRYTLLEDQVLFTVNADGTVTLSSARDISGQLVRWRPTEREGHYASADGHHLILSRQDGQVASIATDAGGQTSRYFQVHGLDDGYIGRMVVISAGWLMLAAAGLRLVGWLVGRMLHRQTPHSWGLAAWTGVVWGGLTLLWWDADVRSEGKLDFSTRFDGTLFSLSISSVMALVLVLPMLTHVYRSLRDEGAGVCGWVEKAFLIMAAFVCPYLLLHFNFINLTGRF